MAHVVLRSPLAPVPLAEALKTAVGDTLDADTPKRVTGNGTEQTMLLWVHRPRIRNDFKTVFDARMSSDGTGTRIAGELGPARRVRLFMGCWLGFVGLFLIGALGIALFARPPLEFILPFAGIPALMFAFGIGLYKIGGIAGRRDADAILAFLADTVDARPTSKL